MKRLFIELSFVAFLLGYFLIMIYTSLDVSVMITIPVLLLVPLLGKVITNTYYEEDRIGGELLYPYILFSFFVVATNGISLYYSDFSGISNYADLPVRSITMLLPIIVLLLTSTLYFFLNTRKISMDRSTTLVKWANRGSTIIYFLTFFLYLFIIYK